MIFSQLKSILKNKANLIYFIVLFVLFIIFNICLNIDTIVYKYYNSKIETDCMEAARTITITELINLSEENIQDIKKNKHIENVYNKFIDLSSGKIEIYCITVDNWANVNSVIKEFDENGINCMRSLSGPVYDALFKSYENIQIIIQVTKISLIIVSILLLISCWKNILKNEEKNINMLKTIGYSNSKIISIKLIIFTIVSMIMYITTNIITNIIITNI